MLLSNKMELIHNNTDASRKPYAEPEKSDRKEHVLLVPCIHGARAVKDSCE